jgi:hypothetical protein
MTQASGMYVIFYSLDYTFEWTTMNTFDWVEVRTLDLLTTLITREIEREKVTVFNKKKKKTHLSHGKGHF